MPTKGVYSHIIEPNRFVSPLDINVYQQGQQYKEGIAKENLQLAASAYGQLSNIPAYGVDAMQLQKEMESIKSQFLSGNMSNLNDPNTFSHINSIINNAKNNPNIQAIAKRGSIYSQELEKKKKADEKGESYTSPALDTLQEYYFNNEKFYEKPEGVNLSMGWTSPQMHKLIGESLKNVPKVTKNVQVGGYWKLVESYDPDALQAVLQDVYNRDDVKKEINWRLEKETKGKDWVSEGIKDFKNKYMLAQNALQINPTDQKALNFISSYSQLINNPDLLGKMAKDDYFESKYKNEIQQNLAAYQYQSEGKMDADDFKLKAIDHQNKMQEDFYKQQVELFGALSKEEQDLFRQGRLNQIDFNKAYQIMENNKLKNAKAANPNYKVTSSDAILNWTDKQWSNFVFQNVGGKLKIADNPNSKQKLLELIQANPDDFPTIPQEVLNNLQSSHIEVKDDDIEIDPNQYDPRGDVYTIPSTVLVDVKNKMIKKNSEEGSNNPSNSVDKPNNNTSVSKTDTVGASTANLINQYLGK